MVARTLLLCLTLLLPASALADAALDSVACRDQAEQTVTPIDNRLPPDDLRATYARCMERAGYTGETVGRIGEHYFPDGSCRLSGHSFTAAFHMAWVAGVLAVGGIYMGGQRFVAQRGRIWVSRGDALLMVGSVTAGVTVWMVLLALVRTYFCA